MAAYARRTAMKVLVKKSCEFVDEVWSSYSLKLRVIIVSIIFHIALLKVRRVVLSLF